MPDLGFRVRGLGFPGFGKGLGLELEGFGSGLGSSGLEV